MLQDSHMLLDLPAAGRELGGLSESTLKRLIQSGSLPIVRIGRRVFVPRDGLAAFIAARGLPGGVSDTREKVPA